MQAAVLLAGPGAAPSEDEAELLRHLTGLAAVACQKGVMPPLLPHPPPCPLLDITQHTARLQTSSGRGPTCQDGQLAVRTSGWRPACGHATGACVLVLFMLPINALAMRPVQQRGLLPAGSGVRGARDRGA